MAYLKKRRSGFSRTPISQSGIETGSPATRRPLRSQLKSPGESAAMRVLFVKLQIGFGQRITPSLVRALVEKCLVATSEQMLEFRKNLRTISLHRVERRCLDETSAKSPHSPEC